MTSLRRRLGLRDEVLLLLAGASLLLVLVSTFTLFAYHSALGLIADERRAEAASLAGTLAEALSAGRLPTPQEVSRLAPALRRMAVVDARGHRLVETGGAPDEAPGALLAPLGEARARSLSGPVGLGPDDTLPGVVAGFAPVGTGADRRYLRVDLPAGVLAPQLRSVRALAVLVLAVNGALVVLLALFLRHLVLPFDRLVTRARQLAGVSAAEEDEAALLRSALERAFAALASSPEASPATGEDDIAALRRTLASSLESGVVLLDRDGSVVALNQIGCDLLGVEPPPPSGGLSLEETFARYPELAALLIDAVSGRRGVSRHELDVEAPAGRLTLGLTAHPLRRDDGSVRGHLVLFADLTESRDRARQAQLAESLAGLGELAAGVAHELRNSLATFRGYLTLIERSPGEESITDYLGEIRHETDHLQRVLEDFLAFARPGSARVEAVDLLQIVHRAASDPALPDLPLAIRDERPAPAPVHGDPQLLERALRNLLHNATAAVQRGEGGSIEVLLRSSREGQEIVIDDDGPGLPSGVRERLFQPFVTTHPGGIGLGLALSRRIVDLHGGTLHLLDRPEGGTRALIRFAADATVTRSNDSTSPPPPEDRGGSGQT